MKTELKWIALVLYWVVLFTLVMPYLISAASTELVVGGFMLWLVSFYATYRLVRSTIIKLKGAQ